MTLPAVFLALAGFSTLSAPSVPAAAIAGRSGGAGPDAGDAGWLVRITPPASRQGESRAYSPTASFALEPGQGVAPGAPIEDFEATFDATVAIASPGKYRFGAETEGGVLNLTIFGGSMTEPASVEVPADRAGRRMSKWIDLQQGTVNLQYTFTRRHNAKIRLRAMWEKQGIGKNGFRAEPIPFEVAKPIALGAADVKTWLSAQHGRVLLGELGCVACHTGPGVETVTIRRDAPLLGGLASRINPDWAKKWMTAPQSLKPGCGMPSVLLADSRAIDGDNITQFLISTGGHFESEHVATEPAGVDIGRRLYSSVGCVACHAVPDARGGGKPPNPLTNLAGKWNPTALSQFLQDPLKTHTAGRMPSLKLNPQEADAIATYLVNAWGKEMLNPGKQLQTDLKKAAELGRTAFASMGCANCHQVGGDGPQIQPTLTATPLAKLNTKNGCLSPTDQKTPRYQLSKDDRAALAAAITQIQGWSLPAADPKQAIYPVDRTSLTLSAFGCRNCHEYNGQGGVDPASNSLFVTLSETDLGDEGRIPPRLNGVGGKLNSQWLAQVLGEGARARPYMAARMPVFGHEHTQGIVPLLAQADGVWPNSDKTDPKVDDTQTQLGRRLVGEKGLNCISCHVVGNNPPAGTPGPDITAFAARLRYEWWSDYIHNPSRFKPGTRMPSFFENGASNITDVLSGDPDLQADAMWAYFTLGEFAPAPEGLVPQGGFKIRVLNHPMVLRTFLNDAGSRGIAVGFPDTMGGVHFAFDAERVRLVDAWRGDFLDASGAWSGRGGNVVGGQGPGYWKAPAGPAVVIALDKPQTWPTTSGREAGTKFRGYRLDEHGVPTFMYSMPAGKNMVEVGERFEPTPDGHVKRTFEVSNLPAGDTAWINVGPNTTVDGTPQNAKPAGAEEGGVVGYTAVDPAKPLVVSVVSKP
jgi:mono/diheme cytochrome c family protein